MGEQSIEDINRLKEHLIPYLEKSLPEHSIICILAKQGDTVAGIGILQVREQLGGIKNPSGKWGYIMNIYTVPAFRRQGICNHIVNGLTDEAQQLGITNFELHATPEGASVYEAAGFIKHKEPTYRKSFF